MTTFGNPSSAMQVTISLLPVSLSLVHVPRSRLAQLSHPVLRQILQPNPKFLNVTCNEIELSLFAEHQMLQDFEQIARHDRQRQRSRSGSGSSRKNISRSYLEPVEISYDRWSALQIDSHSDQLDKSGARVHELSTPLAAAGISILYQSSYMSDFILVKETRLQEVMAILGSAGFDLYSTDPNLLTSRMVSPMLSPVLTDDSSSMLELSTDITMESAAVLTRTRSSTDASLSRLANSLKKAQLAEDIPPTDPTSVPSDETVHSVTVASHPRSKSHSPTSGEVRVLASDLACVGLSDDNFENWGLKIVKLVAFPELISPNLSKRPTTSDTYNMYSSEPAVQHMEEAGNPLFEPFSTVTTPPTRGRRGTSSSSSSSTSSGEDGYFSHSPSGNHSTSSPVSSAASRSYPDITKTSSMSPSFKPALKRLITPLSPIEPRRTNFEHNDTTTGQSNSRESAVGFFSFTRTTEGSSLTTDVSLLAALFPPNERHMVICGGELDAVDNPPLDNEVDDEDDLSGGILKCLQIDLRRFGLDKHGLVNRFSRVLGEDSINHMYSSTFKTANLLVDKVHANRAQGLLRAC